MDFTPPLTLCLPLSVALSISLFPSVSWSLPLTSVSFSCSLIFCLSPCILTLFLALSSPLLSLSLLLPLFLSRGLPAASVLTHR